MRGLLTAAVLVAAIGGAGTATASQCDPKAVGGCLAKCLNASIDADDPVGSLTPLCGG